MRRKSEARFRPQYPRLGTLGSRLALPPAELYHRCKHIYRPGSRLAVQKRQALRAILARGERAYLAGIGIGGVHNTGVALVEIDPLHGPRVICNNEEERFSGRKHTKSYPRAALQALRQMMKDVGLAPERITAWLGTWDYPVQLACAIGAFLQEIPASLDLRHQDSDGGYDVHLVKDGLLAPHRLGELFDLQGCVPIIGMPHHDNHASFSYLVSPFASGNEPVMVLVSDGTGDCASISLYLGLRGKMRLICHNGSLFDSLGIFYSIISSTQGGWTHLSCEGRYMGAAAYGDMNRDTNRYYSSLSKIFRLEPDGFVHLNRTLANWHRSPFRKPYSPELIEILGPPIALKDMWNPNAVLRVEDIRHQPHTQERVERAAATQLVYEDGLFHIVDSFIRSTGSDRLVLCGGTALNALANMHLLERFDEDYYSRVLGRRTRLHLWVPPVPGDAGVTLGAAYSFALSAGVPPGPPLRHAFYCGRGFTVAELTEVLRGALDLEWMIVGDTILRSGIEAIADLMASITARDGVFGIVQGPAETGPRALGHRSILANAANPRARELINERVKYRESIRPLAPMATLRAAKEFFELNDGARDDDYNAYNYMVITVRAKPQTRRQLPAVVHVDGTARIQIVREETDPITHAYLKALGKRTGAEIAVNTSFNVGAPIAQTTTQVLDTLRRAKGMEGVFMFADDGPVLVAWVRRQLAARAQRIRDRVEAWRALS
jgi:carbamoyltransferase